MTVKARGLARAHRHILIVSTLLILAMTFPTIVYVLRTDIFWHPAGASQDVYIDLWGAWYGKLFLAGQADRYHTNLMFYPQGVSLVYHPFFLLHIIAVNALGVILPISNALSLVYLLIIFSTVFSAYIYVLWLFNDKWIALFGSVIFGLSPHVVGHPYHSAIAWIAPIPLVLYCFHRGIQENRAPLIALSALLAGLTSTVIPYSYVIVLSTLGFYVCAFACQRWRDKSFWLYVMILLLVIAVSSGWQIYPLVADTESASAVVAWRSVHETRNDLISFFVNHNNPILGSRLHSLFQTPYDEKISVNSYLGYLPLLLICFGLASKLTRRKMLPWAILCAPFLVLRLGSNLTLNGVVYPDIVLPKYHLSRILPYVIEAFREADIFMIGALLPFSILACFGLVALQTRFSVAGKPGFILALVCVVALEYYVPVEPDRVFPVGDKTVSEERFAFLDWLAQEDVSEIRLINLPMGRINAKVYNLYQTRGGYPQVEGAISRTPDDAFDYIRNSYLLNTWHNRRPADCEMPERLAYQADLERLEADGFSHVIYHRDFPNAAAIGESFKNVLPSYENQFVSIYRMSDLRDSCPTELSERHLFAGAYADALQHNPILVERHGTAVIFAPTLPSADHFMRYLRHFARIDRHVMTIAGDDAGNINIQSSKVPESEAGVDLERYAALWLVHDSQFPSVEQSLAAKEWFWNRFNFCVRVHEDERTAVDLYLRSDIPCSVLDAGPGGIRYDGGLRLESLSIHFSTDLVRLYMAWTNFAKNHFSFSIQFFDRNGDKALQQDYVVPRELLAVYDIDTSSLSDGVYTVQLIVYDFETRASQGGAAINTGKRFERELEIARIEL